jgi:hypothetical protein
MLKKKLHRTNLESISNGSKALRIKLNLKEQKGKFFPVWLSADLSHTRYSRVAQHCSFATPFVRVSDDDRPERLVYNGVRTHRRRGRNKDIHIQSHS